MGNSSFQSGGAIYLVFASGDISNSLFSGNSAADNGGGLATFSFGTPPPPNLHSCTFAGNLGQNGGDSISFVEPTESNLVAQNCIFWNGLGGAHFELIELNAASQGNLIEGGHPTGTNTLTSNPLFNDPDGPDDILGTSDDDLGLVPGSPAINTGINAGNTALTDLNGNTRVSGNVIDRGAMESIYTTFSGEHPALSQTGDANNNGLTNFTDYALGGDPGAPNDPSLQPTLIGNQLTFSFRNNAADVFTEFQKSDTLLPGSWQEMIEATDYTINTSTIVGDRTIETLDLLTTDPILFFREEFTTAP